MTDPGAVRASITIQALRENEQLKAEVERLKTERQQFKRIADGFAVALEDALAETGRLQRALKEYGIHNVGCIGRRRTHSGECSCGYANALAAAKEEP